MISFNYLKESNNKLVIELNDAAHALMFLVITTSNGIITKTIIK